MHTLCCPLPLFRRLLRTLAASPERRAWLRVGVCRREFECIWLARSVASEEGAALSGTAPVFEVVLHGRPPERTRRLELSPLAVAQGRLVLDLDAGRAFVTGLVRVGDDVEPLVRVTVPGSGMREIRSVHAPERLIVSSGSSSQGSRHDASRRWLRTIGALGGEAVYRRLVAAPVGVVGCGRLGALVATSLALLGVHVTLIDADRVEPHNLGEMMGVSDRNVGQPKVLAVSGHLSDTLALPGTVTAVTRTITDPEAVTAAKACAVLFCCADNDAARLATGFIATFHHKVLVDVGTGVFVDPDAISASEVEPRPGEEVPMAQAIAYRRLMGADVRLILPGDGCLRCRGSLADYDGALRELSSTPAGHQRASRTRAGSLFTLNTLAASIAVQMYQDLVSERLLDTTWAHVRVDDRGRLSVDYPPMPALPLEECPLCARAGIGDRGV